MAIRKGHFENNFVKELETPKATVLMVYSGDCKYDLKNNLQMSMLGQLLNMVYLRTVREDAGGTYGVSCNGSLSKYPTEKGAFQVYFDTDPNRREEW